MIDGFKNIKYYDELHGRYHNLIKYELHQYSVPYSFYGIFDNLELGEQRTLLRESCL